MNAESKHSCPICGKSFKTKKALQQHKSMVHNQASNSAKMVRPPRRRRRRAPGRSSLSQDIAPSRIPPVRGGRITISGEDRLAAFDIKKGTPIFANVDINPSVSSRLSLISRAFQRIRWNSVTITATPQASAVTNGGYVCGLVMDPSDRAITAKELSATQGAQTKKWYETAVVRMPSKPDLLYTTIGEDIRLSTPCTFWIVGEGRPSADLTLILSIQWSVTLMTPTVEENFSSSFTMSGELRGNPNNYNLSYYPPDKTTGQDDASGIVPITIRSIPGMHFFRVPTFIIEYKEGAGDTGTIQAHFIVYKTSDKKMYYSSDGSNIISTPWQGDVEANQCCVPCGTVCKYVGQGNSCKVMATPPSYRYEDGEPSPQLAELWSQSKSKLALQINTLKTLSLFSETDLQELNKSLLEKLQFEELSK